MKKDMPVAFLVKGSSWIMVFETFAKNEHAGRTACYAEWPADNPWEGASEDAVDFNEETKDVPHVFSIAKKLLFYGKRK